MSQENKKASEKRVVYAPQLDNLSTPPVLSKENSNSKLHGVQGILLCGALRATQQNSVPHPSEKRYISDGNAATSALLYCFICSVNQNRNLITA